MKEKLIIQNFGPIKSAEITLGRFNVFIGEQGTGKSTVAKLLAVCRYFSYLIPTSSKLEQNKSFFEEGLREWGIDSFIKKDSFIVYDCDDYTVEIKYQDVTVKVTKVLLGGKANLRDNRFLPEIKRMSPEMKHLVESIESYKTFKGTEWFLPASFFLKDVKETMDNPLFFRTERALQSVISLGKKTIENLSDTLFSHLAHLKRITDHYSNNEVLIEPLNVFYLNKEGEGYIRKNSENEFHKLSTSATGYQTLVPLVLGIDYYIEVEQRRRTYIIEEPELNLFPTAQNKLVQYLVDKTVKYGNKMLLTTHSPYILTSLNNLMYAYQVGKKNKEETNNIIDQKYWINPEEVSAYMLLSDGTCESIMDKSESGTLIKAEKIDGVSRELNEIFDNLIEIEHNERFERS